MNKLKIINDPVYGFITIPFEIIFDLMEHPWFQRLRRINQLGLTHLVYPGAIHTRFHHTLGALHLMTKALDTLEQKGVKITEPEKEATCIAILLHDIGHGPFSHVLENTILPGIHHETISLELMHLLNKEFKGKLDLAIEIFNDNYPKKYLHQLISSQLDMDRLDYLTRDSFYTGVSEGIVGIDRIISMLAVKDNELVVEEKGIYSIEKFIIARRLMYWQVYLHKTTLAADQLITNIMRRAKELLASGKKLNTTDDLLYFLKLPEPIKIDKQLLEIFNKIDDSDLIMNIKQWQNTNDFLLSKLCQSLINRKLPKIVIQNKAFYKSTIEAHKASVLKAIKQLDNVTIDYFVNTGTVKNEAYQTKGTIKILAKSGELKDLATASDNYNINSLTKTVTKYYLCFLE
ncbi:MAG: HD domain-containing protein [Bacteroidia bacterium]